MHQIKLYDSSEFYNIEHIPIAQSVKHPNYNDVTLDNDFWIIRLQWRQHCILETLHGLIVPRIIWCSQAPVVPTLLLSGLAHCHPMGWLQMWCKRSLLITFQLRHTCHSHMDTRPLILHQPWCALDDPEKTLVRYVFSLPSMHANGE